MNSPTLVSPTVTLNQFFDHWSKLTSNTEVLNAIKGYEVPFIWSPKQHKLPPKVTLSDKETELLDAEIDLLLQKHVIRICTHDTEEFISPIFLLPKKDRSHRFIFNCKRLNSFVKKEKFKMENLNIALGLMTPNCFMATLDLKEAYYSVSLAPELRKYFRFIWKNRIFEFQSLPFGLCSAPRIFTKIMKPVVTSLREKGFMNVIYLDDFLLIGKTLQECNQNVIATIKILKNLGFRINYKKSKLIPSQEVNFLNSARMQVALPSHKRVALAKQSTVVLNSFGNTARDLAELIGGLIAASPSVPYGIFHTRELEKLKFEATSGNHVYLSRKVTLSKIAKSDLEWWIHVLPVSVGTVKVDRFKLEIFSDASLLGWGAACNGKTAQGLWPSHLKDKSINFLEILAAYNALKCFASDRQNENILMRIDNTTAICYINKFGGVRHSDLNSIARKIWIFFAVSKLPRIRVLHSF